MRRTTTAAFLHTASLACALHELRVCALNTRALNTPRVCALNTVSLLPLWNRKNNTLRMSYRAPDEPRPHLQPEGGVTLNGRPSSDVTKGFERLYERSYY